MGLVLTLVSKMWDDQACCWLTTRAIPVFLVSAQFKASVWAVINEQPAEDTAQYADSFAEQA